MKKRFLALLACVVLLSAFSISAIAIDQIYACPQCGASTVATSPVKGELLRSYVLYEDGPCGLGYYRHYVYQYVATDVCNNGHTIRHYSEREEVQFQGY